MAGERTVDAYIEGLDDWRGEVVAAVRGVIREAAPDARESIKWAQPVYESNGPFAYIKAFPTSVNLGFWRGAELDDEDGRLVGEGDRMRHVKLGGTGDVDPVLFGRWVGQAVELNRAKGDPTRRG
jgi:hypothetical protein